LELRRKLVRLKLEAMDLYKQGRIEDPNLLEGFLAHITDLRIHLDTVIHAEARERRLTSTYQPAPPIGNHVADPVEVR
jgi:hypothetical protein